MYPPSKHYGSLQIGTRVPTKILGPVALSTTADPFDAELYRTESKYVRAIGFRHCITYDWRRHWVGSTFNFNVSTERDTAESSILPWLSGFFPSRKSSSISSSIRSHEWPYDLGWPEADFVCSDKYSKLPLQHMAHEIQKYMRSMAVTILGSRHFSTSGLNSRVDFLRTWVQHRRPGVATIYPREDLAVDDAAIHFRCGDVFGGTQKECLWFDQVRGIQKNLIPRENTKSIGIFTQPFQASRV